MSRIDPRLSQAIPYYLRALRGSRPPEWVETQQGKILRQVENRLQQILVEDQEYKLVPEIVAELERIIARVKFLGTPAANKTEDEAKAVSKAIDKINAAILNAAKKPKKEEAPDLTSAMVILMKQYAETGDITAIVPQGGFVSEEEKKRWSYFTMAEVKSVKGRTISAFKLSTGKAVDAMVLAEGVKIEGSQQADFFKKPRKYALLQDPTGQTKLIVAAVPLGSDADEISRIFNALYRK